MKRERQLDIVDTVYGGPSSKLAFESFRLIEDHKKCFHRDGTSPCRVCRALKRAILKGV